MSAYATLLITRSRAKVMLIESMMKPISDETLTEFMDNILREGLYNCCIVDDSNESNDDDVLD